MGQFKPIWLYNNTLYKILTKILVNRINPFMELISPLQGSFTPSRRSIDYVILVQENFHFISRNKDYEGLFAIKIS